MYDYCVDAFALWQLAFYSSFKKIISTNNIERNLWLEFINQENGWW